VERNISATVRWTKATPRNVRRRLRVKVCRPSDVRSSQRNARSEGKSRRQQHSRSSVSATSAAGASLSKSTNEGLLIDLSEDTCSTRSAPPPPSSSSSANKSKPKTSANSASNADVLSLLDGSIAGKYECLPLPLGEKQTASAYDPFEISAELKGFSSRTTTPQHSTSAANFQPPPTGLMSPGLSSSSFDSFSSQGTGDESPVATPHDARSNDPFSRRGTTGSTVDVVRQSALKDNGAGVVPRGSSLTNLPVYGNLPGHQSQESSMSRSYCHSTSVDRNGAGTENGVTSNKSNRSPNKRQAKQQDAAAADFNANPFSAHQVTSASRVSTDWLEDAISKNLSLVKTTANSNRVNADPSAGVANKSTTMASLWDEKNMSKGVTAAAAARKKTQSSGTASYDRSDETGAKSVVMMTSGVGAQSDTKSMPPPPIPPRDYSWRHEADYDAGLASSVYANISDIQRPNGSQLSTATESVGGATRQTAQVRPFVHQSSDIYQNFEEFSSTPVQPLTSPVYANADGTMLGEIGNSSGAGVAGRRTRTQSSFTAATSGGGVGRAPDVAGRSAVDRVHRRVPSASRDECRAALAACNSDVESAAQHLKVDQLVRLGVAPRDRCRTLLEACNWNLESAGSVLLHELSTGSSV
jgi:hypothetical protein